MSVSGLNSFFHRDVNFILICLIHILGHHNNLNIHTWREINMLKISDHIICNFLNGSLGGGKGADFGLPHSRP